MKKYFLFLVITFLNYNFFSHSISVMAEMPFTYKTFNSHLYNLDGNFQINSNTDFFINSNLIHLRDIELSDIYIQEHLCLPFNCIGVEKKTKNYIFQKWSVNLNVLNSFNQTGTFSFSGINLEVEPDFNRSIGCGFSAGFPGDISFNLQILSLFPKGKIKDLSKEVNGAGYVALANLSKNFDLKYGDLSFSTGSFFGYVKYDSNFYTNTIGTEQQYIIDGKLGLFSFYGLTGYAIDTQKMSAKFLAGALYIPYMNNNLETIIRSNLWNLFTKQYEWHRKTLSSNEDLLQNYLFLPILLEAKYKINIGKVMVVPAISKLTIFPIDILEKGSKNLSEEERRERRETMLKSILISGFSINVSVYF